MMTTSCSSCLLTVPPNSAGSISTVPTLSPWRLYTGTLSRPAADGVPEVDTVTTLSRNKSRRLRLREYPAKPQAANCLEARPRLTSARCGQHADLDIDAGRQAQALV